MTQTLRRSPLIFADSNVFVEALFVEYSFAAIVIEMVAAERYGLATCAAVVSDVERAISFKTRHSPTESEDALQRWAAIMQETKLVIEEDAPAADIRVAFYAYLPTMRHKNDIPILAAALRCKSDYILSNNRDHFNDAVAKKCGVTMVSCEEFIELIVGRS